ncbi:response regulator [Halomonas sp. ML-15]|uniref:response regulator n=1 Tax=Halomonas sp. ML-15 TaxID=2773305 RepID=UPI00174616B4|nr:response regulator [Halomonas sp. ML-15]MBD3894788.1 response regulator [Halomonas sp. ML-15]
MTSTTDPRPPLILCAEDHHELRRDICEELKEAGYGVIEAADGDQAMQQLESAVPDLILCDINMPGHDGYRILEDIRQRRPDLADTPFVFLTALSEPRDIVDGKRLGADDYLVKPVDFDLLLVTIGARLRQVRRMRHKAHEELDELRQAMAQLRHEISQQAFGAATRALDLVAPGMVLLDHDGKRLFANRQAQQLVCEQNGLRLDDSLMALGKRDSRALKKILDASLAASQAGEDTTRCLRLPRPGERRDLLLLACSLPHPDMAMVTAPSVVVMLADPEHRGKLSQQMLASLFGLTPGEARIAVALAEGWRTDEIAERLSIATTTVAFHLRNLFQKTDTHRQADLIALLLAGSMTRYADA